MSLARKLLRDLVEELGAAEVQRLLDEHRAQSPANDVAPPKVRVTDADREKVAKAMRRLRAKRGATW